MRPEIRCLAVALAAIVGACSSNHDALAVHPSGSGGTGGSRDAGLEGVAGTVSDAGLEAEPGGPRVLTLLHGVVDAPRLRFCFAPAGGSPSGDPVPPAGLDYGGALVLDKLPGLDLASDAIQAYAITGDEAAISGRNCQQLLDAARALGDAGADSAPDAAVDAPADGPTDAPNEATMDDAGPSDAAEAGDADDASAPLPPPPPLRVAILPVLPAGSLAASRSYLLALMGCIGQSRAFTDPLSDSVCGTGYRPDRPTLMPVLVRLSRATSAGAIGLQVVNASRATPSLTLRSVPPTGTPLQPATIGDNVVVGSIQPVSADLSHSLGELGDPIGSSSLEVSNSRGSAVFRQSWADALSAAGLSSLANGSTYALVVVGPNPSVGVTGKWWNPLLVTVVPTAP